MSARAASFRDQLRPFGVQVAPFVEHYVRGWQPYRNHWNYEDGCIFKGCLDLAEATGERSLADFVFREVSARIAPDGAIAGFDPFEFNIDNINAGKVFARLLAQTGEARLRLAMDVQFEQLERHPRTASGNYWHKQIYPWQVWLDGLYMAQPFQVEYARVADRPELIEDTRRQFAHVRAAMRDRATGLYYHGWDERRLERWSNPRTGCSPCFWGRAMGWYLMALVDCLDTLGGTGITGITVPGRGFSESGGLGFKPPDSENPRPGTSIPPDAAAAHARALLVQCLQEAAQALLAVRSPGGLWYQVLDQGKRARNYEECSASLMFVYALMKGARLGILDAPCVEAGRAALGACIGRFLTESELGGICGVAGLGNVPYRDGSYEYYVSEPIVPNDPKGVGALLMALAEALRT